MLGQIQISSRRRNQEHKLEGGNRLSQEEKEDKPRKFKEVTVHETAPDEGKEK
ncbi:MAG: hypothetical protein ACFFCH_09335 [Promethearchaeota archaeon]